MNVEAQALLFELPEIPSLPTELEGPKPLPMKLVPRLTSGFIVRALSSFYLERKTSPESWIVVPELRQEAGYGLEQRIDVWVMNLWGKQERIAYEIKVSRSDFLHELKQPRKRAYALEVSNRFYFAVPHGLVGPQELPAEAGLVEIFEDGRVYSHVKAPWRKTGEPSWGFMASALRRAHKIGRLLGEEPGGVGQR